MREVAAEVAGEPRVVVHQAVEPLAAARPAAVQRAAVQVAAEQPQVAAGVEAGAAPRSVAAVEAEQRSAEVADVAAPLVAAQRAVDAAALQAADYPQAVVGDAAAAWRLRPVQAGEPAVQQGPDLAGEAWVSARMADGAARRSMVAVRAQARSFAAAGGR